MFNLSSSRGLRSFSAKLLSTQSAPSLYLLHGLIPSQAQDFVFAFHSSLLDFFLVLGSFLFPALHPDCEPQVNMVGIQNFQERDWGVTLSSFLSFVIKEFLVTTWLFYTKNAYSITQLLSNSSAISTLPCRLLLPVLLFPFRNSQLLLQVLEMLFREKEKRKPSVHLLSVFLALYLSHPYFFIFPLSPRWRLLIWPIVRKWK